MSVTVILPAGPASVEGEAIRSLAGQPGVGQILVPFENQGPGPGAEARRLELQGLCEFVPLERKGRGAAVRGALEKARGEVSVVLGPDAEPSDVAGLAAPILENRADLVLGSRFLAGRRSILGFWDSLGDRALALLASAAVDLSLTDLGGAKAFRSTKARELCLRGDGMAFDAELVAKFSRMRYRILEVPVRSDARKQPEGRDRLGESLGLLRAALRYARVDDAENEHGGYRTLQVMDQAPRYAAWLVELMRPHLGHRILEVGAGIGTITRHLVDRELVVPLDLEPRYVQQLENAFRGCENVRPMLGDVNALDLDRLRAERFDTVILSNVLEHLEDDAGALARFHDLLTPGGRLILVVPALPFIYGAIDREVGHHRRYLRAGLERALRAAGFEIERLRALNLLGVPGWFFNGSVLRRRDVPQLQLRIYDRLAPALAAFEDRFEPPFGLSLFCVARKVVARKVVARKVGAA